MLPGRGQRTVCCRDMLHQALGIGGDEREVMNGPCHG